MKRTGFILIDFDNLFPKFDPSIQGGLFEFKITELVTSIVRENENLELVRVRLYGGWYRDNILSKSGSTLLQILQSIRLFPVYLNKTRILGSIDLVSSLIDIPEVQFTHTYKETAGIRSVSIQRERNVKTCTIHSSACPAMIIKKFTRSKRKRCGLEGCQNTNRDMFLSKSQKMVDTILSCDIISTAMQENVEGVLIATGDIDLIPAIILAARLAHHGTSISLYHENQRLEELYSNYLDPFGIIHQKLS